MSLTEGYAATCLIALVDLKNNVRSAILCMVIAHSIPMPLTYLGRELLRNVVCMASYTKSKHHHTFAHSTTSSGCVAPDPQQAGTLSQSIEVSEESLMVSEQLELHQPRAQVRQCASV